MTGRARSARERALAMAARQGRARARAASLPLPDSERRLAARLLELTADGWRVLAAKRWLSGGGEPAACPVLLIGRGGIFALELALRPGQDDGPALEAIARAAPRRHLAAANSVAALNISPVAIQPLLVVPGRSPEDAGRPVRVVGEFDLQQVLLAMPKRVRESDINIICTRLAETVPAYTVFEFTDADGAAQGALPEEEPEGLFTVADAERALLASTMAAPAEKWMTFLSPHQARLVSRTFQGPARISGPAGTGKTVVGLHRAVYLAQRNTRRILFVTFANNLPRVQHTLARMLSPQAAERVEFTTLHRLALDILEARGIPARLHGERAAALAARAWQNVGTRSLRAVVDNPRYWLDEIDYVIKGRMIADLAGYRLAERRGRRMPLRAQDREAVWALYEEYERLRRAEGIEDFNDVLALALAEAVARPLEPGYGAVIVDEVQDLTLTGIRLLHALSGDGPNGLLLIGDGQQAVYPGGYRLSEAGITVPGARGVVLTANYRNRPGIVQAALKVVGQYTFEDLDESTVSGHRSVETTLEGGDVTELELPSIEQHDDALVHAVRRTANGPHSSLGDVALLCPHKGEVERYRRTLHRAGLPTLSLEAYDGSPSAACKIGTYTRAKGLDFKHVFIPRQELAVPRQTEDDGAGRERTELAARRLYVAMTRARDSLWIGTVRPSASGESH